MAKTDAEFAALVDKAKNHKNKIERDAAFDTILKEIQIDLKKLAARYYINGADAQDTLQEAYIGVWKAVMDWDQSGGMAFRNFAINLCCKRHIITAMSTANRKKYDPLNNAVSLSIPLSNSDDDNEQYLSDFIPDSSTPLDEQYAVDTEYERNFQRICDKLTKLERAIFEEYMKGQSYHEIAEVLTQKKLAANPDAQPIKPKAVDNALMRIRKKATELYKVLKFEEENQQVF